MKFCSECGAPVVHRVPQGDNLPRYVCEQCATIHYHNPRIVAGTLATSGDRILLCRRAIEPRHGYWTLPAGFMENGETIEEAAARETAEEARAKVEFERLYTIINVPHIGQVHMMYLGRLVGEAHEPGPESLATELVHVDDIPWDELAFPSVRFTLERFIDDRRRGTFSLHTTAIQRSLHGSM